MNWLAEATESVKKFGQEHTRLFPLLDRPVMTKTGAGILWQSFAGRAGVVMNVTVGEKVERQVVFMDPKDVMGEDIL
jgi:hypothetical protein